MRDRLENYFRASFPGLAIQTAEEARALNDIIQAAKNVRKDVAVWSTTEGLKKLTPRPEDVDDTQDLVSALRYRKENTVFIFRDMETWPFANDPILTRSLKDMLTWAPTVGSVVVALGVTFKPQPSFEKQITILDYTLPGREDFLRICKGINEDLSAKDQCEVTDEVLRALAGLTTTEAENALALSVIETRKFDASIIYREKVQAVKRTGLLEIIDPDPRGLEGVGGLENLKEWILKRRRAFTPEAEAFGLPSPKGILLVGVPGTGKSLTAKAVGTALAVPTIKLDVGALFNSLVGESEARTREALKLAEAMSPCMLWVDEIDKGLAGASGSGSGDSGVTRRVFGTIITWMQERRRPVFLVATANNVTDLPPEFLRKGRFDEIFAIDLPNQQEREEIFAIHLKRKRRDADKFNLASIAKAAKDFTGSEIEAVIDAALYDAFDREEELTEEDLMMAIGETVPLAVTAKDKIEDIRSWGKGRARFASKVEVEKGPKATRRIGVN